MQFDLGRVSELITLRDVHDSLRELDVLQEALYKTGDESFAAMLSGGVGAGISVVVSEEIKIQMVSAGDTSRVVEIIDSVRQALKVVPVVKLQVALELPMKSLKRIHDWLEVNVTNPVVVEVEINPELLGGVKVTYSGKYIDKSVAGGWSEMWHQVTEQLWSEKRS